LSILFLTTNANTNCFETYVSIPSFQTDLQQFRYQNDVIDEKMLQRGESETPATVNCGDRESTMRSSREED